MAPKKRVAEVQPAVDKLESKSTALETKEVKQEPVKKGRKKKPALNPADFVEDSEDLEKILKQIESESQKQDQDEHEEFSNKPKLKEEKKNSKSAINKSTKRPKIESSESEIS